MNKTVTSRGTATVMVLGAVAANVAFVGLGSTFDYPDVLHHPSTEVLASFRDHQGAVAPHLLGGAGALTQRT